MWQSRHFGFLVLLFLCSFAFQFTDADTNCVYGLVYPDRNLCECFTCWNGSSCSELIPNCQLSCETNEGYIQTEYWTNVAGGIPVTDVASSYRTDYQDPQVWHPGQPDPPPGVFGAIRQQILRVHSMVGNVKDIMNKSMIIAHGATQLLNAAIDAFAKQQNTHVSVVAVRPYYYLVPGVSTVAAGSNGFYATDSIPAGTANTSLVEIITAPRNPDGVVSFTPSSSASSLIYDNVFYWPSFTTDLSVPLDFQVSIFSLSKLSGLSGSRLGWAFVQDPNIANLMGDYVYYSTHGITVDAQYRASNVIKKIADDNGALFEYVSSNLASRWSWLSDAFATQDPVRFKIAGVYGFPVAWIDCVDFPSIEGCSELFGLAGMKVREKLMCIFLYFSLYFHFFLTFLTPLYTQVRAGSEFGMAGYVRMNMMVHTITWQQMQVRLTALLNTPSEKMERMIPIAINSPHVHPRYSS
jgi:aspartate/methionine/tyrosine aminotransferase